MNKRAFFLYAFLAVLLQVTLLPRLAIVGVSADICILIIVAASLVGELGWVLFLAMFCAFFRDIYSSGTVGIHVISYSVLAAGIVYARKNIPLTTVWLRVTLVFVVTLLQDFFALGVLSLTGQQVRFWAWVRILLIEPAYTAAIAFFVFRRWHES